MSCTNPIMIKANDGSGYMMVPCGKCIGCRLDKARDYSVRLANEKRLYDDSVFITLTYDDEHMPEDMSIHKSEVQKFLKLVRKRIYPEKIRYFLCGEYGDQFGRPHYHLIVFNLSMFDERVFTAHQKAAGGYVVLCSCWDKGRVHVGNVTRASASYVARYTMKKVNGHSKEWYQDRGIEPEFILMSLKPGIGFGFMDKYKEDILNHDAVYVDGVKFRVPRYYSKKLNLSDTIGYEIKANQKHQEYFDNLESMSSGSYLQSGLKKAQEREQRSRNNKKFMEQKGR